MADYYDTGTVTVTAGSRTFTGTGASWANLIRAGDTLEIGGRQMRVASVESGNSGTLKLPAPASASGAYAIWYDAPSRTSGLQALEDMRRQIEIGEILMAMRVSYAVRSATLNAPPASPVTGDLYLISTAPTGAWAGYAGHLAQWTGTGWAYTAPQAGMGAIALDTGKRWDRDLTGWVMASLPTLATVATSGKYADLSGLPTLGTAAARAEAYFQTALGFTPINKAGDTMTGTLSVGGEITSTTGTLRSISSNGNKHLWFQSDGSTPTGLIFSNVSNNTIEIRPYTLGTSTFVSFTFSTGGNISLPGGIFAGAGFYGVGNIDIRNASGWGGAFRSYSGSDWASSTQRTSLQHQSSQSQLIVLGGAATGTFTFASTGNFSASGSKNFYIDHPLGLEGIKLVHAAVEAPEVMLQYRGVCQLVNGRGTVNIDEVARMTPGTFAALTADAVVQSLCNVTGFERVRPSAVTGASFEILADDPAFTGDVAWLVTAIRKDPDALRTYNAEGLFEVEPYHIPQIEPDAEQAPSE